MKVLKELVLWILPMISFSLIYFIDSWIGIIPAILCYHLYYIALDTFTGGVK